MNRLLGAAVVSAIAAPALVLGAVVALAVESIAVGCEQAGKVVVGSAPDGLTARTADGTQVGLSRIQLGHARTIAEVGASTAGVGREGVIVALTAALTESGLRMLANKGAYPESAAFPHDGDGSDRDSLGLFQMRPAAGWGSVPDLMDPAYQARAFYGGPTGPNHGSPRGLLDLPHWETLGAAKAAQAVEVSAYPDRYARWVPVAEAILAALTDPGSLTAGRVSESSAVVFPLPDGTGQRTSGFGVRRNPVLGVVRLHAGVDLAAPAGTPVLATADGQVVTAQTSGGLGSHVAITHTVGGRPVVSVYGHLLDGSRTVQVGAVVTAGQQIGAVGSTGNSTGPHLHFEIRPGDPGSPAVDPSSWLDGAARSGTFRASPQVGTVPDCPAAEVPR